MPRFGRRLCGRSRTTPAVQEPCSTSYQSIRRPVRSCWPAVLVAMTARIMPETTCTGPRIAFGQAHPEVPIHFDRMILSESEMDRDATYEWYGSHGLRYYIAGWAGECASHRAYMSLQRSRQQGHVNPDQVDQFALVLRHVSRSIDLATKLGTLDRKCQLGSALIHSSCHAVFVVASNGKVLMTNARAESLLAQGDGLFIAGNRLACRVPSQQQLLDSVTQSALESDRIKPGGGWLRIHRQSGRHPYVVLVSRFADKGAVFSSFEPKALIVVSDPADTPVLGKMALHDVFGLTPTEASIASALTAGHSIESAAALLGIRSGTARDHLKSAFRKLGVNRQQDLVRLLTSLSSMTAAAGQQNGDAVAGAAAELS